MNNLQAIKEACSMVAQQKQIELPNGTTFDFWHTPLTIAERQRAQKQSRSEDSMDFALQLVILKIMDENGTNIFPPGSVAEIRNDLPAKVIDALIFELFDTNKSKEGEEESPKNLKNNSKKTGS